MHLLVKVDFRPYHSNSYLQLGLCDSQNSIYMSRNHQNSPITMVCDSDGGVQLTQVINLPRSPLIDKSMRGLTLHICIVWL